MSNKPRAILFPAHDWAVVRAAHFASEMKKRRGLAGIALVHGTKDARCALQTKAFDEVVDVVRDFNLAGADAEASANSRALADFERAYGGASIWQCVVQDARRRYKKYSLTRYTPNQILKYLSHAARELEPIFSRWDVIAVVGDLTSPVYRMVYQMGGTARPYLVPVTARFFHRFYFDDDMYMGWEECVRAYRRFWREGVPPEVGAVVDPIVEEIGRANLRPTYFDDALAQAAKGWFLRRLRPSVWADHARDFWFDGIVDGPKNPEGLHWSYWLPPRNIARRAQYALRRFFYHRHAVKRIPDGVRYALFLPNSEPEYTLDVQGWPFADQASLIRVIAQSLPVDMLLLVKDHPLMVGARPIEFYRRILRLPNVRLISESCLSQELLRASRLVFTITGTIALEAVCAGIPAIMFGKMFFDQLEGVTVIRDLYELSGAIDLALTRGATDFGRSARAALAAMFTCSYPGRIDSSALDAAEVSAGNRSALGEALEEELCRRGTLVQPGSQKLEVT